MIFLMRTSGDFLRSYVNKRCSSMKMNDVMAYIFSTKPLIKPVHVEYRDGNNGKPSMNLVEMMKGVAILHVEPMTEQVCLSHKEDYNGK